METMSKTAGAMRVAVTTCGGGAVGVWRRVVDTQKRMPSNAVL